MIDTKILDDAVAEYARALKMHGNFNSAHEGYAVTLEELDELKEWVWMKSSKRNYKKMYDECIQVAAMALKFADFIKPKIKTKTRAAKRSRR